jgi:hypothetical protein
VQGDFVECVDNGSFEMRHELEVGPVCRQGFGRQVDLPWILLLFNKATLRSTMRNFA